KSILRFPLLVNKREDQPGKFRALAIEQTVGRKMQDAVLTQLPAHSQAAAGAEVSRFEPCSSRSQRNDALGFLARECEPCETGGGAEKIHSSDRPLHPRIPRISPRQGQHLSGGASFFSRRQTRVARLKDGVGQDGDRFGRPVSARRFTANNR